MSAGYNLIMVSDAKVRLDPGTHRRQVVSDLELAIDIWETSGVLLWPKSANFTTTFY
jgi:hypothetical protein